MVQRIITQAELRSLKLPAECGEYVPPPGSRLTPDAREYLVSRGIGLGEPEKKVMPMERVENRGGDTYVNAETGEHYAAKPEHMTHLSGNRLVSKDHGRIQFRGCIDSLEADVLELQALAAESGEPWCCGCLGELLEVLRDILAAEVREKPLPALRLFGLSAEEIHVQSHDVKGTFGIAHPVPDYTMGSFALGLNTLRTRIREGELLAVRVFCAGEGGGREDIILGMNRLSSAVYWLFCRYLSRKGRERKL